MNALITGLFISIFGVMAIVLSWNMPSNARYYLSPGVYPQVIGGVLAVLGLTQILLGIIQLRKSKYKRKEREKEKPKYLPIVTIIITLAYILLLPYAGFELTTALVLFILVLIFGGNWKQAALCSLIVTLALYMVFEIAFNIPLPNWTFRIGG